MDLPTYLKGSNEEEQDYNEQLNQALRDGLANGVYNQEFSQAEVDYLTHEEYFPPLRAGTVFFNTDIQKLQVIVVSAVPQISSAIVETITSA